MCGAAPRRADPPSRPPDVVEEDRDRRGGARTVHRREHSTRCRRSTWSGSKQRRLIAGEVWHDRSGQDGRALGVPAAPAPSFRELFVMHRAPNDPRLTASRIMSALKLTKVQGHRGARATSTPALRIVGKELLRDMWLVRRAVEHPELSPVPVAPTTDAA